MQLDDYRAFTAELTRNLADDPHVLGLIALGSMAEQDYLPDQWSDHDFFVVTEPGHQEAFRTDLSWLPDHQRIAFWFRDSPHALRAVFDSGHLLEFVLFDEAANLPSAEAALRMLDVAEPALRQYMPDFPEQHIAVARRYLASFDGD